MASYILGISAFYHDSAAALVLNGEIIAAAHEERFTRKKHDSSFPANAVRYVLREGGIGMNDLEAVCFYDKPYIKFERMLETYHAFVPSGLTSFLSAIPVWIREKLFMKKMLKEELRKIGPLKAPLLFPEHHLSHAASAFYPSPFSDAAILTIDGVGEWATTTIGRGTANKIEILRELHFPHSAGLLYSAFTYYTGFMVNSGEYKLMGLAPYGNPDSPQTKRFREIILTELIDLREDGSLLLNMKYFQFATGLRMTHDKRWQQLFGIPPRNPETPLSQDYMNMALAIQQVLEDIVLRLADTARRLTGCANLVMAGGVALNSVANGKLLKTGLFKDIWIQPAAGDAGGAVGAALLGWHLWKDRPRTPVTTPDAMKGAFLGPEYSDREILRMIHKYDARYHRYDDFDELIRVTAGKINEGSVVGWFQGRMEYGPRALGNRSILGDARNPEMQKKMNLKIKFREGFRPFAPTVLEEDMEEFFETDRPSPYMLHVIPVVSKRLKPLPAGFNELPLYDRLYFLRSDVPAITHVDYSARIQSVAKGTNYRYWALINEFKRQTGYGLVVNTSFNVRGEPIVCSPDDAYRCFMRSEIDCLVIGDFLFEKLEQPGSAGDSRWQEVFRPD
ncbi:MAG TPA: carbamoyltransferase [Bacteroidales bacterium]|nr:carbamoyltransferase [Bacteroidales bacterium]HPS63704.1 carbamoyltransferase [Bacteroidales bacterium]